MQINCARHQLGLNNSKGRPALRLAIAKRSQALGEERTAMARRQQGYSGLVQASTISTDNHPEHENRRVRRALPLRKKSDGNLFRLTNSYRNGHIDRL